MLREIDAWMKVSSQALSRLQRAFGEVGDACCDLLEVQACCTAYGVGLSFGNVG